MRSLCFLVASLALASGCGGTSKEPAATGGAGQSSAGTGNLGGDSGTGAGGSGSIAGSSSVAGSSDGGSVSSAGSAAGGASGGGASGGASGGGASAGETGEGGEPGLVDCDARKVTCKVAAPTCGTFQVPSVEGSCYGECVNIQRCACSEAAECPDPGQFTCWKKQHCGPYVN